MSETLGRVALRALAAVLVGVSLAYAGIRIDAIVREPAAELGIEFEQETLRFVALRPDGAAKRAGLEPHDRLLAIDGAPVKTLLEVRDVVRRAVPGEHLGLTVNLAGLDKPRTYEVVLDPRRPAERRSWLGSLGRGLALSLPLWALAAAGVVLFRRAERPEAWLIALVTAGAVTSTPLLALIEKIPPGARGYLVAFKVLAAGSAPALFHYLLSIAPERSGLDRIDERIKSIAVAFAFACTTPFAVWALTSAGTGFYLLSWPAVGVWLTAIAWIGALALGGVALWECATLSPSAAARQRARNLAAVAVAGAAPATLLAIVALASGRAVGELSPWARMAAFLPLALVPLGAGEALLAPRVLPLRVLLRRFARFVRAGRGASLPRLALEQLPATFDGAATVAEVLELLVPCLRQAFRPSFLAVYLATGEGSLRVERGDVAPGMEELPLDRKLPPETAPLGALDHVARVGPDCIVPLRGTDLFGVVVIGDREGDEPYSGDEIHSLATIGAQTGTALERLWPSD